MFTLLTPAMFVVLWEGRSHWVEWWQTLFGLQYPADVKSCFTNGVGAVFFPGFKGVRSRPQPACTRVLNQSEEVSQKRLQILDRFKEICYNLIHLCPLVNPFLWLMWFWEPFLLQCKQIYIFTLIAAASMLINPTVLKVLIWMLICERTLGKKEELCGFCSSCVCFCWVTLWVCSSTCLFVILAGNCVSLICAWGPQLSLCT